MSSAKYSPILLFGKMSRPSVLTHRSAFIGLSLFLLTSLLLYVSNNGSHLKRLYGTLHPIASTNEWICADALFAINTAPCLAKEFIAILQSNHNLIVLEPSLLKWALFRSGLMHNKTLAEVNANWADLKWRFNLPDQFAFSRTHLVVGLLAEKLPEIETLILGDFVEIGRTTGTNGPFDDSTNATLHHVFYRRDKCNPDGVSLLLHVVVLHSVRNFLWIGSVSNETAAKVGNETTRYFGRTEQIFDPFTGISIDGISYPDDVEHFLSQLFTARYLHCPPARRQWIEANNLKINYPKVRASEFGFIKMKKLMRKLRMHFWLACGTLLGWYRQCHITPYTSDTDMQTWAKYMQSTDISPLFLKEAPKVSLKLVQKFGEPTKSQEFTLYSPQYLERYDLFFIYPNGTHFLLPFHVLPKVVGQPGQWGYSIYPMYDLCSVEILGYKLLAPCDPEAVILTEYGPDWRKPVNRWDYSTAPHNVGPLVPYNFSEPQWTRFG